MNGRYPRHAPGRGFTLIELMITVAIIGILSAIAYPSYRESVAKGRRADARTQLVAAQQWMERVYSESYTYQTVGGTAIATALAAQPFSHSPRDGNAAYDITVSAPTATTYVLTATRTGIATGDACGNFTLTNTGLKSIATGTFGSKYADLNAAVAACW